MKNNLHDIIVLIRPHQYIKNIFIILPLFFGGKINDINLLFHTLIAFIAFCITSSAVYVFNDLLDIERDRKHEKKKFRPLASGAVSKTCGLCVMIILFLVGNGIMLMLQLESCIILWIYIIMNLAYSLYLKNISIIDITIVSLGFVLRLFIGSSLSEIPLSIWIITMTFLLALFISLAKRRDDVLFYNSSGIKTRKTVDGYNLLYLDSTMILMASVVIVSYILYTTSIDVLNRHHGSYISYTSLFVILGLLRFMQNTFVEQKSGVPTKFVLKDSFMILVIGGWVISFVVILYS